MDLDVKSARNTISFILMLYFLFISQSLYAQLKYVGVNLAGAEFGSNVPGTFNKDYTYPTRSEVDYFVDKGMNVFRLPFKWERLQHSAKADLNAAELSRIKSFVDYAASKEAYTILNPHNYARYDGEVIGGENLDVSVFEDFWQKLAMEFNDQTFVIFGLMNEPYGMDTELWLTNANAAISAIRATGATNLILVPGNAYTGAHSWNSTWYGTPNGTVMQGVIDPLDNYAFEVHQYLDDNSSGTSATCVNTTIGSARLQNFTNWLRTHGERGFLGEFGVSTNDPCLAALDDMLAYMGNNADVWLGWAYWAAGPWWGDYMFSIEPRNGQDRLQMDVLEKHLSDASAAEPHGQTMPSKFLLRQNYPNPFNGSTQIDFEIPYRGHVELNVYNVSGQKIAGLLNHEITPGHHSISWSAHNAAGELLPSGIYFYALKYEHDINSAVKRMLLMQ
jgi:endoglucanase